MTVFETVYIVLILKQVPCKNCKDLKEIYRIDKKKLQEICRKSKRNKQYVFYGLENNRSSKLIKEYINYYSNGKNSKEKTDADL